jgi:hypothetical protein
MVKLKADLSVQWEQLFEGPFAYAVLPDKEGGYVGVGTRTCDSTSMDAAWLIHTDPDGVIVANREFMDAPEHDKAFALAPTSFGYVAAGSTRSLGCGEADALIALTSSHGVP